MPPDPQRYTLFIGNARLANGNLETVARAAYEALPIDGTGPLVLSDLSGRPVDLDLRGSAADVSARYADIETIPPKAARGRPKLGVVPREVTLLPRHWEWLGSQPGGASAALRKLVEQARRDSAGSDRRRQAQEVAHRMMTVLAGNLPNYEEALRALYADDKARFRELASLWPKDVGDYILSHAENAWIDTSGA